MGAANKNRKTAVKNLPISSGLDAKMNFGKMIEKSFKSQYQTKREIYHYRS